MVKIVPRNYKAIDFYSGIGGWTLGLKFAGINVTDSYEWWDQANNTHLANLKNNTHQSDIRELSISNLPNKVDIVVGSPPCTQFSYSNRGGSGDIEDGLKDIKKFLDIVKKIKPKFWAMENVPRVEKVLQKEILPNGKLYKYRNIINASMIEVYDFSEFGLPQKRKRCIAGNFDHELLKSYKEKCKLKNLGTVINSFDKKTVKDCNFNISISSNALTDNEKEEKLSKEELRFNKSSKTHHAVYNDMSFPDSFDKPVRTITATCTRVSRESVIIKDEKKYRRLTVRERSSLQGFPISYQFFGNSYSAKLKMIGNAIPPVFTYYLANSMIGTQPENLVLLENIKHSFSFSKENGNITTPETAGKSYPENRSFRFAIPNLRFKSGTRFELNNKNKNKGKIKWAIYFYFGDSKRILELNLNLETQKKVLNFLKSRDKNYLKQVNKIISNKYSNINFINLQKIWTGREKGDHPFNLLDCLGKDALSLIKILEKIEKEFFDNFVRSNLTRIDKNTKKPIGITKLEKYSREITAGIILGCVFNLSKEKL